MRIRAAVRACHAADGHCHAGAWLATSAPTAISSTTCSLTAPCCVSDARADAQLTLLGFVGIGDEAAVEPARTARHIGEQLGHVAAGAGLGRRHLELARQQLKSGRRLAPAAMTDRCRKEQWPPRLPSVVGVAESLANARACSRCRYCPGRDPARERFSWIAAQPKGDRATHPAPTSADSRSPGHDGSAGRSQLVASRHSAHLEPRNTAFSSMQVLTSKAFFLAIRGEEPTHAPGSTHRS